MSLEGKGRGLVLTNGTHELKLSDLGRTIRLPDLEKRFGEAWKIYAARGRKTTKSAGKSPRIPSANQAQRPQEAPRNEPKTQANAQKSGVLAPLIREVEHIFTSTLGIAPIPPEEIQKLLLTYIEREPNADRGSAKLAAKELLKTFFDRGTISHDQYIHAVAALERQPTQPTATKDRPAKPFADYWQSPPTDKPPRSRGRGR
ncbi:hypothetical protein [Hyphomicrobium sp. CS1BSMeth3]|uniref:hypothetical protein n=1 Tax=Hyphomicrobium sp. CS1BSMeth3 TaxID=1892844 RepID=UPI0011605AC7|nr:hypothetical protein [Hyphomicrobium sp. CS1BSMeth3]